MFLEFGILTLFRMLGIFVRMHKTEIDWFQGHLKMIACGDANTRVVIQAPVTINLRKSFEISHILISQQLPVCWLQFRWKCYRKKSSTQIINLSTSSTNFVDFQRVDPTEIWYWARIQWKARLFDPKKKSHFLWTSPALTWLPFLTYFILNSYFRLQNCEFD